MTEFFRFQRPFTVNTDSGGEFNFVVAVPDQFPRVLLAMVRPGFGLGGDFRPDNFVEFNASPEFSATGWGGRYIRFFGQCDNPSTVIGVRVEILLSDEPIYKNQATVSPVAPETGIDPGDGSNPAFVFTDLNA